MKKHRSRESKKPSAVHANSEKVEQLKRTKTEIENHVTRIFKLIKNEGRGGKDGIAKDPKKDSELLGLIEDFYKQYQSLYAMPDHRRGDSCKVVPVRGRKENAVLLLSPSSSGSEYFSTDEISEKGKLENENHAQEMKQALETSKLEVVVLKHKLASTSEEKEALNSGYMAALSKIQEAEGINKDLRIEVKSLRGQQLKERNIGLNARVSELESLLKFKRDEVSSLLVKLKYSENYSTSKIAGLMAQASNLQLEANSSRARNGELEEQIEGKVVEINQLREEMEGLHARNLELERALAQRGDEFSAIQKRNEIKEKEFSTQVNNLQQDLDSLQIQKRQLELEIEREKQDSSQMLTRNGELEEQIEDKVVEINQLREEMEGLHGRNLELERALAQKGDEFSALQKRYEIKEKESSTQVNNLQQDLDSLQIQKNQLELEIEREKQDSSQMLARMESRNKSSLKTAERKMEELAEKFRRNLEDNMCLLDKRILVNEHLHTENKDCYRMTKERHEQEIKELEDILEKANNAFSGSEPAVMRKFELQFAMDLVTGTSKEMEGLKHNMHRLVAQFDDKVEQAFLLRERVWNLEAKLSKEGGEKLNMIKAISKLEKKVGKLEKNIKEKDETLLSLGDEKRKAIRQLCVLIDYHQSRYQNLKEVMSKMNARRTRS